MQKQNLQPQRRLQECKANNNKSEAAPQTSPFLDVFDDVLSSHDLVNIPKKREVGFARQTDEQEKIKLDGRSSSLTNWTVSCR